MTVDNRPQIGNSIEAFSQSAIIKAGCQIALEHGDSYALDPYSHAWLARHLHEYLEYSTGDTFGTMMVCGLFPFRSKGEARIKGIHSLAHKGKPGVPLPLILNVVSSEILSRMNDFAQRIIPGSGDDVSSSLKMYQDGILFPAVMIGIPRDEGKQDMLIVKTRTGISTHTGIEMVRMYFEHEQERAAQADTGVISSLQYSFTDEILRPFEASFE